MAKLLPVLLALLGLAIGAGAGYALKPGDGADAAAHGADAAPSGHGDDPAAADPPAGAHPAKDVPEPGEDAATVEFVKLNNQFVVPVVDGGRVSALVVLSVSLEVALGRRADVYQMEPKLRDGFLRVLFDHANSGGFGGTFTASTSMTALRLALLESARGMLGPDIQDVLITDIVRQDN